MVAGISWWDEHDQSPAVAVAVPGQTFGRAASESIQRLCMRCAMCVHALYTILLPTVCRTR